MSEDLGSSMRALLSETEAACEATQAKLKALNDAIVMSGKYLPRVSRRGASGDGKDFDPVAEIQAEIDDLEYTRETSSLGLTAEKDIVRKMAALKKQQAQFVEMSNLKAARKDANDALTLLMARKQELKDGMRSHALVERIRSLNPGVALSPQDITTTEVRVPQPAVGRVVGKGGSNRVAIEKECGVILDVQDGVGSDGMVTLKVTGVSGGISAATARIEDGVNQEEESIEVAGGLANLLLTKSGAGIKQLEGETGVRAQVSRSDHRVLLVGSPRCVAEAKSWLATVQDSRVIMPVPTTVLPAVIGTGGANFQRIQKVHGVEIDVRKPGEGEGEGVPYTLTVWGIEPAALEAARGELLHIIAANTKHTLAIAIDPAMIPYLVGEGGDRVKKFQKEHNIGASVKRAGGGKGTGPSFEGIVIPEGAQAWLECRGVRSALASAEAAFAQILAQWEATHARIKVSAGVGRSVIGRGGEGARALRESLPGVIIDVELGGAAAGGAGEDKKRRGPPSDLPAGEAVISLKSEDPDKLAQAKVRVSEIVAAYREDRISVPDSAIVALVKKGGEIISKLQADSGASIDIDRSELAVTVSGPSDSVATAIAAIQDIVAANYSAEVGFDDPDVVGAIVGKKGENIKKLQEGLEVSIDIDKRRNKVVVRGRKEAADEGVARVVEFLARHAKENASLVIDTESVPALIGKEGATIRKLQEDTGAQIDVNSSSGDVRVKGPEAAVAAAVAAITTLCGLDKAKATVPYDERALAGFLGKNGSVIRSLAEELKVTITLNRGKRLVLLRGEAADVDVAKGIVAKRLQELVRVEESVVIPTGRLPYLMGAKGARIRQLQSVLGVSVDVPKIDPTGMSRSSTIVVKGQEQPVKKAKVLFEALAKGQSVAVLQFLPQHAVELSGRSSRNLERLRLLEGAVIEVDPATGIVVITSPESSIAKVTSGVENVIAFTFPAEFASVPVPGTLLAQLTGDSAPGARPRTASVPETTEDAAAASTAVVDVATLTLAKLATATGAKVAGNTDSGYVTLCGTSGQVAAAKSLLSSFVTSAADRYAEVSVQEWMIPVIVGTKGANIIKLQEATGAKLDVDRKKLLISVTGASGEGVAAAKEALTALVAKLSSQRVVLPASAAGIGAIIGRGGATIRRLQEETGASIDLSREEGNITIRGADATSVANAVQAVQDILKEVGGGEGSGVIEKRITVERRSISVVIGSGGATVRGIEESTGARVTIDKDTSQVVIRGSEDAVIAAISAVKSILSSVEPAAREGEASEKQSAANTSNQRKPAAPQEPVAAPAAARTVHSFPVVPVGASDEAAAALLAGGPKLDKNARRRLRKKQAALEEPTSQWSEGLAGISGSGEDILASLLSSVSAAAPVPAVRRPAPPPGIPIPSSILPPAEGASLLARLAALNTSGSDPATSAPPAAVPAPAGNYYVSASGFSVRL